MAPQNPPQNTAPGTIPPPPETDPAFQQSELVNDVRQDWKERLFGALAGGRGGSLDDAIQRHHQGRLDEARMHRRNASTATGNYYSVDKLNRDPTTGDLITDPDVKNKLLQQYATEYQSSMGNYAKIAGVNPQTKQAIQKAQAIVDHLTGIGSHGQGAPGQPTGQGAAPQAPQYGTTVSDTGVSSLPTDQGRQGGLQPPPNYRSNVSDTGVSFSAPPTPTGGGATAQVPQEAAYTDPTSGVYHPALKHRSAAEIENMGAAPPPPSPMAQPAAPSAPPQFDYEEQAPFIRNQAQFQRDTGRKIEAGTKAHEAQVAIWTNEAKQIFGDLNSVAAKRYALTGTFGPASHLQLKPIEIPGPNGPQRVLADFDPIEGTTSYQGKIIDNPQIADKPQLIKYMKPDAAGKPHLVGGFMVGTELFDQQMHPLPPNTEFYSRGLQGRDTLHQSITMGPDGKPIITTLESVSNPTFTKAIWGDEPNASATLPANAPAITPGGVPTGGGGKTAPAVPQRKGGVSAAPKPQATGGGSGPKTTDAMGRPLGLPAGQFTAQSKAATGVDQARNSLVGDNIDKGEVSGLAKDLGVFKSPDSMKRIGEYLQLVHNQAANEGDSFAHSGDTFGAVKWFAGLPQLNISLQQGALRDQYGELTTDEKKFVADYFRVMGTMGGMRASTGMPGYQWAFTNMYNEMPTPGKVNDYDDAVRRLMNYVNETNVVSKRNSLVTKVDVQDAEKQIRGGSIGKAGMSSPPTSGASPTTAEGYLAKFGIKPAKKP